MPTPPSTLHPSAIGKIVGTQEKIGVALTTGLVEYPLFQGLDEAGIIFLMSFDFDNSPDRSQTNCAKWRAYPRGVLPMWVADMDFLSPPAVIRALQEQVSHGVFGYPAEISEKDADNSELNQVIVARLAKLYNWEVRPSEIVFLPGVAIGFHLACHAFAVPDGGVLVQTPVYRPILEAAHTTGAIHQETPLTRSEYGAYAVDWEAFDSAVTEQTRLFLLCNPHNPVGKAFQVDELARMAEVCLRQEIIICSDEIHGDMLFPGQRHIPIASLAPEIASRTITLMAPSKTFNLPGLQFSFAVIQNPQLRREFLAARRGLVSWVNPLGMAAALAAYRDSQEWLDQLLIYLCANRDLLVEAIERDLPGIEMYAPQATYLAWLDCRKIEIGDDPYRFFLDKAKVALNDGKLFGKGGEGFVRLNFGCPRATLAEGVRRMALALSTGKR